MYESQHTASVSKLRCDILHVAVCSWELEELGISASSFSPSGTSGPDHHRFSFFFFFFLNRSFFEDELSSKFSVYKSHISLDWSNLECHVVFRHGVRCGTGSINVTISVYRKLNILTSAESEPYSLSSHLVESLWKSWNQLKSILKTFFSYCRWTDQSRNRLTGRCTLL